MYLSSIQLRFRLRTLSDVFENVRYDVPSSAMEGYHSCGTWVETLTTLISSFHRLFLTYDLL